ncbi:MAG: 3-dehydroquinate synthase [Halieaceae bacterium]|jgi:3-dehydroquinate synthase
MTTLQVDLGERSYPIYINAGLLRDAQKFRSHIAGQQLLIVTNETVAPLYLRQLKERLGPDLSISEVILPDGEQYKTLQVLEQIFDVALRDGHNRSTTILALGGGVVGDMAGFAAASYQRGVRFLQVPTTLLAQVDSSVGGKTAVNHPLGKNMIGAFYQPAAVFIDTEVLDTLPPRQYAAGLAETIKYGLICDRGFYEWMRAQREALKARDGAVLEELIERSCTAKAAVVAADEREGGLRAILNFGHTFGHAIEAAQGYGVWLHGEAVAAGMVMALRFSQARGWIGQDLIDELIDWLRDMGLPVTPPTDMSVETWMEHMSRDKKVTDGRLRLIALSDIGSAVIVDDVSKHELESFLSGLRPN